MDRRVLPFRSTESVRLDDILRTADPAWLADLVAEDQRRRVRRRLAIVIIAAMIAAFGLSATSWLTSTRTGPDLDAASTASSDRKARARALEATGNQLLMSNRPLDAESPFRLAVELAPERAGGWSGLGWSLLRNGDRAGAEAAFIRSLGLDEASMAAHNGLGLLAYQRRDYQRAGLHWRRLGDDQRAAAAALLGGRWREAEHLVARLRVEDPANALLAAMARAAAARAVDDDLRWALHSRRLGGPVDLELARAWRLYESERFAAAEDAFRARFKAEPGHRESALGLGFSLLELGRLDEARPLFLARLAIAPTDAAANHGLALGYRYAGDLARAITLWERGLTFSPPSVASRQHLPDAYLERGDGGRALPAFLHLLRRYPGNERVLDGIRRALDLG